MTAGMIDVLMDSYETNLERYEQQIRRMKTLLKDLQSIGISFLILGFIIALCLCTLVDDTAAEIALVLLEAAAILALFCAYIALRVHLIRRDRKILERECGFYDSGRLQVYRDRYVCADSWAADTKIAMKRRREFPDVIAPDDWEGKDGAPFLKDAHISGYTLTVHGRNTDTGKEFSWEQPITFIQYCMLAQKTGNDSYLVIDQKTGRIAFVRTRKFARK